MPANRLDADDSNGGRWTGDGGRGLPCDSCRRSHLPDGGCDAHFHREIVGDLAIQLNGHTISAAKNATVFSIETEADLKIVGPGTVEGYRAVNRNSTSATISCDAEGSVANIAITDEVTVIGGSIHKEENPPKYQGQAEEAIVFKSLGTLTVSDSTISGGRRYCG